VAPAATARNATPACAQAVFRRDMTPPNRKVALTT
jgi:hypothetical protein